MWKIALVRMARDGFPSEFVIFSLVKMEGKDKRVSQVHPSLENAVYLQNRQ